MANLTLPGDFQAGKTYLLKGETLLAWRQALQADRALPGPNLQASQTPHGRIFSALPPNPLPPFLPRLGLDGEVYYVTVTDGRVTERDVTLGVGADAMLPPWECPSRLEGDGRPHEFPIASGQAIYVQVRVLETGRIGWGGWEPAVDLVVEADDVVSSNPILGLQDGIYYYQLAKFLITDGVPELTIVRGGSHIDFVSGLSADVILEDCSGDQYADPVVPGAMLIRMSFVSGVLAALNDSYETRPLAPAVVREQFTPCSESYPV